MNSHCELTLSVESTPLVHHLLRLADACLLAPAVANCSFIICSRALLNNLLLPVLHTGVDLRPRVIGLEVPGTTPGRKRRGVSRGGSPHCCGKQTGGRPCAEGRSKAIERHTSHLRHAAEPHSKQGTDGSTAAVKYLVMSSMWSSLVQQGEGDPRAVELKNTVVGINHRVHSLGWPCLAPLHGSARYGKSSDARCLDDIQGR